VGTRFSVPVQTGPGAHPAFCTIMFSHHKNGRVQAVVEVVVVVVVVVENIDEV
jgi:hypothetical protein